MKQTDTNISKSAWPLNDIYNEKVRGSCIHFTVKIVLMATLNSGRTVGP